MSTGTSNRNSSHAKKYFDWFGGLNEPGRKMGNFFVKALVDLPIASSFREVATGSIGSAGTKVYEVPFAEMYELDEASSTADTLGSQLSTATTPALNIANTDAETTPGQAFLVTWVANGVDALLFQVPLVNFDGAQNITITLRGKMSNTNDTPVIYSKIVVDEADTVVADTSDTFTSSYANHTITIATADLPATGNVLTVRLTPAAHANDSLILSDVLVTYGTLATTDTLGGLLTKVSTPKLDAVNGTTDNQLRIQWAAADVSPIVFQCSLPDIDDTEDMQVIFRCKSAGSTDTPSFSIASYFNEGDTAVADSSAASAATVGEKAATIAASDIPSGAKTLTCRVTPSAHNTDALDLYAAYVKYCRKFPMAD